MRISDWSSDVCSSDLRDEAGTDSVTTWFNETLYSGFRQRHEIKKVLFEGKSKYQKVRVFETGRSEEHTSELQSLMRISYAVFCLKKKIHSLYLYVISHHILPHLYCMFCLFHYLLN